MSKVAVDRIELNDCDTSLFEIYTNNTELQIITTVNEDIYAKLTEEEKDLVKQFGEKIKEILIDAALR